MIDREQHAGPSTPVRDLQSTVDFEWLGRQMHDFLRELFPLHRSITGKGLRETLARISARVPLEISEIPSGTRVLDWTIPPEWTIRSAWIKAPDGSTVLDLAATTLHVVSYSTPVHKKLPLSELRGHLHSLPNQPSRIPYRTTYYKRDWGFCLPQEQVDHLADGEYEVFIDSTLEPGSLTIGEALVGTGTEQIIFSAHVCHPSLANDNLSAVVVAVALAQILSEAKLRHTYRFVFAPATVGAIAWLANHRAELGAVEGGIVLASLGDRGTFTYKRSRDGDALMDRTVVAALRDLGVPHSTRPFTPLGYDERQYGSPGFALPVGCLMRTPPGEYSEYHTSSDDLDFVTPGALAGSLAALVRTIVILEENQAFINTSPYGEPQLGRRGLYESLGGRSQSPELQRALLWVLNLSDGSHDLLDIADRSELPFATVRDAADILTEHSLLIPADA